MHWTESQIAGLARAFYRFEPVVCPACTSHVAVERMPISLSGGASHLRFTCRGCRKTGELSGFVEPAEEAWAEREIEAIVAGFRWGVRVKCPGDGAVLTRADPQHPRAGSGDPADLVTCPICGRRTRISSEEKGPASQRS